MKYCINGSEFRENRRCENRTSPKCVKEFFVSTSNTYFIPRLKIGTKHIQKRFVDFRYVYENMCRRGLLFFGGGVGVNKIKLERKERLVSDTECAICSVLHISLTSKAVSISAETSTWDRTEFET